MSNTRRLSDFLFSKLTNVQQIDILTRIENFPLELPYSNIDIYMYEATLNLFKLIIIEVTEKLIRSPNSNFKRVPLEIANVFNIQVLFMLLFWPPTAKRIVSVKKCDLLTLWTEFSVLASNKSPGYDVNSYLHNLFIVRTLCWITVSSFLRAVLKPFKF